MGAITTEEFCLTPMQAVPVGLLSSRSFERPSVSIGVICGTTVPESVRFAEQVKALLKAAGFDVAENEYRHGMTVDVPKPWLTGIAFGTGKQPVFAGALQNAFREIGIEAEGINATEILPPGTIKVFVGSK